LVPVFKLLEKKIEKKNLWFFVFENFQKIGSFHERIKKEMIV
jgi:hypothetical protein